ncbi:protein of unknown function [Desulfomicrobium norvegicum]|uniref:DUF4123 domain-containing protein n=1 Tax=Desulfomicrobium norvegicum (strain DSM 1741 / NCIMB 8310) TaxID=52561 RepID=A0A8G2C3F5_DESNO|nr:DUF4123 domain-containing protein [Desulfomicrobium norvegicum]SFL81777.1 protein of unknown function [Desulfomicrobium norvegicum]
MSNDILKGSVSDCVTQTHGPREFEEWRAGIRDRMTRENSRKWCAVIDPASDPDLPGLLWTHQEREEIWPLFMNTMLSEISLKGPIFVALQPGGKIADWLLTNAEISPIGVLYAVAEGKENDLFEHLQNLLEIPLPDAGTGLLRFYDPRVLHALTYFGDKTWCRRAVGPAECLHAWEPGRAEALELREGTPEILRECPSEPLQHNLLNFMARHNAPYAVLHEASTLKQASRLTDMPVPEAFFFVENVCRSLDDLGICGMADMAAGVAYCLDVGANIFGTTSVAQWMKASDTTRPFPELLANLPDELSGE